MPRLILNADDFGRSPAVNAAVLRAHREGCLTSASLMVTGEAAPEAVALAKGVGTLAVGLHIVLARGRSALSPDRIPDLVDAAGRFDSNPLRAGLRYALHPAARRELAVELRAQFERFAATGLPLSHVDGHLHLHLHPAVFGEVLSLACEYGAGGVRVPRDELGLALRYDRRHLLTKLSWALAFTGLIPWCLRRMRGTDLRIVDRVYGLYQSGCMEAAYVERALERLQVPAAEFYFHPSTDPRGEPWGPNPADLSALTSARVRKAIEARGIVLATYATLMEGGQAGAG